LNGGATLLSITFHFLTVFLQFKGIKIMKGLIDDENKGQLPNNPFTWFFLVFLNPFGTPHYPGRWVVLGRL